MYPPLAGERKTSGGYNPNAMTQAMSPQAGMLASSYGGNAGGGYGGGYQDANTNALASGPGFGGGGPNVGPGGGPGSDPFGYTNGSLLTPWTQQFQAPAGSGGGYSAPAYTPFQFADFNPGAGYNPGSVSTERLAAPDRQAFTAYHGQSPYQAGTIAGQTIGRPDQVQGPQALNAERFTGPSFAEAQNDPGYQLALKQGNTALGNKFAASGLRGAGQGQALADYNQAKGAEQYQNVWNRAFQGNQANNANAAQAYGLTNQYQQQAAIANQGANQQAGMFNAQQNQQANLANESNRMQAHGMNESNALNAYNSNFAAQNTVNQNNFNNAFQVGQANNQNNIAAYTANTNAGLGAANLDWQRQSGTYDRNYAAARTNWQDAANAASAQASAGSANANQSYNRALQEYQMNYGIFQDNQSNQFNRLMAMANLGNPGQVSPMQYAGGMSDIYSGRANAQAAGQVGSGNAWNQAFGGIASGALGAAGSYAGYRRGWNG